MLLVASYAPAAVGASMADHLDLMPVEPAYRATFTDGSALDVHPDAAAMAAAIEDFAGPDFWRAGIRRYIASHAYQNSRTTDLWAAVEAAGARGLTAVATDFTTQPGIPLISVSQAQCINGSTVVSLMQGQFLTDRREEVTAKPQSWRVPIKATAGGTIAQVVTNARTTQLSVPGCGPCSGCHQGMLAPAENAITNASRNFKGRFGSPEANAYVASSATVAASAIAGRIAARTDMQADCSAKRQRRLREQGTSGATHAKPWHELDISRWLSTICRAGIARRSVGGR